MLQQLVLLAHATCLPPSCNAQTIPFIAELLEDTDAAVEARTQQLVALLEEISGEKLDQYMT